jgi:hypothetical protein
MKIVVDDKYTYESEFKVRKGQRVVLPSPYWLRDVRPTWIGKVTDTKSDYTGYCEKVISVAKKGK